MNYDEIEKNLAIHAEAIADLEAWIAKLKDKLDKPNPTVSPSSVDSLEAFEAWVKKETEENKKCLSVLTTRADLQRAEDFVATTEMIKRYKRQLRILQEASGDWVVNGIPVNCIPPWRDPT